MGERANFVDEGFERVQSAYQSVEEEIQKLQKQLQERTEELSDAAEKRFRKISDDVRGYPVVKRAESLADDVSSRLGEQGKKIEQQVTGRLEQLLGALQVASRADIEKLDRKLNRLGRKLNAIDKALAEQEQLKPTPSKPDTAVAE